MKKLLARMKDLLHVEKGATMVEYAIMVALIAVVSILVVQSVGNNVKGTFQGVDDKLTSTMGTGTGTGT